MDCYTVVFACTAWRYPVMTMAPPSKPTPTGLTRPVAIELRDVNRANEELREASAEDTIRWADRYFPGALIMSSSFGAQSAVMLHLLSVAAPHVPVILVDTGYLFPETYRFADEVTRKLGLDLRVYGPSMTPARMEALHGKLWTQGQEGHERYGQLMKVEPMDRAIRELGAKAWLAGLRKDQSDSRASLDKVVLQNGMVKVHPIVDWTRQDVGRYLAQHELPWHPLVEKGYASIGDTHSTRPITAGEDERSGRFHGFAEECGLHVPQDTREDDSMASADL